MLPPQSGLDSVSRASRQYSLWLKGRRSRQPCVFSKGSRPSVAPAVSTLSTRHTGSQHRRPSVLVPTVAHRPLVAPKVSTCLRQWPRTCPWCILHGCLRVGPGRVVVSPSRQLRNVRLPFIASSALHRPPSIHTQ